MKNLPFWDRRENMKNRPSLQLRTIRVIEHLMEKDDIAHGVALERLIKEDGLFSIMINELKDNGYADIN